MPSLLFEVSDGGAWLMQSTDGQRLRAGAGQGLVVPAEHPHELTYVHPVPSRTQFWLLSLRDVLGRNLFRGFNKPWVLSQTQTQWLMRRLKSCESQPKTLQDMLRVQRLHLRIAEFFFSGPRQSATLLEPVDPRVEPVLRYINAHLDRQLSRDTLAALIHLSPTRFHYVFSQATGMAPTKFVIDCRLNHARDLLARTDKAIKAIATACGYSDPARFSAHFRRRVGIPPTIYRSRFGL